MKSSSGSLHCCVDNSLVNASMLYKYLVSHQVNTFLLEVHELLHFWTIFATCQRRVSKSRQVVGGRDLHPEEFLGHQESEGVKRAGRVGDRASIEYIGRTELHSLHGPAGICSRV